MTPFELACRKSLFFIFVVASFDIPACALHLCHFFPYPGQTFSLPQPHFVVPPRNSVHPKATGKMGFLDKLKEKMDDLLDDKDKAKDPNKQRRCEYSNSLQATHFAQKVVSAVPPTVTIRTANHTDMVALRRLLRVMVRPARLLSLLDG